MGCTWRVEPVPPAQRLEVAVRRRRLRPATALAPAPGVPRAVLGRAGLPAELDEHLADLAQRLAELPDADGAPLFRFAALVPAHMSPKILKVRVEFEVAEVLAVGCGLLVQFGPQLGQLLTLARVSVALALIRLYAGIEARVCTSV